MRLESSHGGVSRWDESLGRSEGAIGSCRIGASGDCRGLRQRDSPHLGNRARVTEDEVDAQLVHLVEEGVRGGGETLSVERYVKSVSAQLFLLPESLA